MSGRGPIEGVIERWFELLKGDLEGGLASLLDDDVVFYSPVVYTPQRGKTLTLMYLTAAGQTMPGDQAERPADEGPGRSFRYTKRVLDGHTAVLEFETQMDGLYVNGVDIIVCNDEGRIVEFRVMIRPLKALDAVHRQMQAALESMKP